LAAARPRRQVWAASTEVSYITDCPNPNAKSATKWADGAMILPGDVGVLLEVKTVGWQDALGAIIGKVPADLAALVSADWIKTVAQPSDRYSGPEWVEWRGTMRTVLGLSLCFVHGSIHNVEAVDLAVDAGTQAGLTRLRDRYADGELPGWFARLRDAFDHPHQRHEIHGARFHGVLYGWSTQIAELQSSDVKTIATIVTIFFILIVIGIALEVIATAR
jgi:hypothetical protein